MVRVGARQGDGTGADLGEAASEKAGVQSSFVLDGGADDVVVVEASDRQGDSTQAVGAAAGERADGLNRSDRGGHVDGAVDGDHGGGIGGGIVLEIKGAAGIDGDVGGAGVGIIKEADAALDRLRTVGNDGGRGRGGSVSESDEAVIV